MFLWEFLLGSHWSRRQFSTRFLPVMLRFGCTLMNVTFAEKNRRFSLVDSTCNSEPWSYLIQRVLFHCLYQLSRYLASISRVTNDCVEFKSDEWIILRTLRKYEANKKRTLCELSSTKLKKWWNPSELGKVKNGKYIVMDITHLIT